MTSLLPKLALAAALTAAIPGARAHACDDRSETASFAVPAYLPPADAGWRGDRDGRGGWRARELHAVRAELRDLDAARARFYAEGPRSRREMARFERWFDERRAELERRRDRLQSYAWR
jgi:hypothetical protein